MTARQYDINVPDAHQPVSGGTPAVPVTPLQAVTPCPRPPRATPDTRVNSRDYYCLGLENLQLTPPLDPRAGYGAQYRAPVVGQPQQQGRQRGRGGRGARGRGGGRGGGNGHPSGLGLFTNPGQDLLFLLTIFCSNSHGIVPNDMLLRWPVSGQACYIVAPLQGVTRVQLDQHLDLQALRGPQHRALDYELVRLCVARRDPQQRPLSPLPIIATLNPCLVLGGHATFNNVVAGGDSAELLSSLLGELDVQPGFLVETLEQGVCQICGNQSQQVIFLLTDSVP